MHFPKLGAGLLIVGDCNNDSHNNYNHNFNYWELMTPATKVLLEDHFDKEYIDWLGSNQAIQGCVFDIMVRYLFEGVWTPVKEAGKYDCKVKQGVYLECKTGQFSVAQQWFSHCTHFIYCPAFNGENFDDAFVTSAVKGWDSMKRYDMITCNHATSGAKQYQLKKWYQQSSANDEHTAQLLGVQGLQWYNYCYDNFEGLIDFADRLGVDLHDFND